MGHQVAGDTFIRRLGVARQDEILDPFLAILLGQAGIADHSAIDKRGLAAERQFHQPALGASAAMIHLPQSIALASAICFSTVLRDSGGLGVLRSFGQIQEHAGFLVVRIGQSVIVAEQRAQFDPTVGEITEAGQEGFAVGGNGIGAAAGPGRPGDPVPLATPGCPSLCGRTPRRR